MNIWLLPSTVAERPLYTENTNTNRYPPPIYISTPLHKNFHRQHRRNALQSSYLFSIKYSPDFLRCFSFNDSLRLSIYTTVFLKHIGKRHYGFLYSRKMWMHLFFVCLFTSHRSFIFHNIKNRLLNNDMKERL